MENRNDAHSTLALSTIARALLSLHEHQLATKAVLRSLPGFDEQAYRKELQNAQNQVRGIAGGVPNLAYPITESELARIAEQLQSLLLKK